MTEKILMLARLWPAWLIAVVPFLYFMNEPFTVALHQAVAVPLMFLLFTASPLAQPSSKSNTSFVWLFRFSVLWLALLGISVIKSIDLSVSLPLFLKIIGLFAIAISMCRLGEDAQIAPTIFAAATFAAILHGLLAWFEYFEAPPIPASWLDPEMRGLIPTRCAGIFSDPNVFGAYLAALIPFTLGGIFTTLQQPLHPLVYGAGFFAASTGLLTTFSRTAYLAALLAVFVFFMLRRPRPQFSLNFKVFLLAVGLVAVIFFSGPFRYRLFSIANTSDMTTSQRTLINRGILSSINRIPITGFGLHTFAMVYPQFRIVGGDYPLYAHNEFLQTLIEAGPIATLLLAIICGILGWQLVRLWRLQGNDVGEVNAAGAAAWAALVLQNLAGFSARIFPTAVLIAISTGLVMRSMIARKESENDVASRTLAKFKWSEILIAGLGLVVFLLLTFRNLHLQLRMEQAQIALKSNDLSKARHILEELKEFSENQPLVLALLARLDEQAGNIISAQARWAEAARLNPYEATFWAEQSRLASQTGQGDAIALMQKAVQLDPASELYRLQMARLLASSGQLQQAVAQLDEALRTSPNYDEVYTNYKAVKEYRAELLGIIASSTGAAIIPPTEPEKFRTNSDTPSHPENDLASQ